MKRRPVSPFSVSFLDIMFCGFGAVVLLVLILDQDTLRARDAVFAELRAEAVRLEQMTIAGREQLAKSHGSLDAALAQLAEAEREAGRAVAAIAALEIELAGMENDALANQRQAGELASDLKRLQLERQDLGAPEPDQREQGSQVREVSGEGDRQYLTGLKMGGSRVLILMDVSASMLDETIVNVVRRRNMDRASRQAAPKWRRALKTAEWLIGNLPAGALFQLYLFDTSARAAAGGSDGRWLQTSVREDLDAAIRGLGETLPDGGTSLYHAFAAAAELSPRPDNILLVTDGLPTQGRVRPGGTTVTAGERLQHFRAAARALPPGIPVNTVLLPMEGDAYAAAAYWKLAQDTRGSFLTPARDWP